MAVWQPPEEAAPAPEPEIAVREYIVILNKGIDYDAFWSEIENESSTDGFVPTRRVDIINERPGSLRSCHYSLTDEEATQLRSDPRVYDVEIPPQQRDDIKIIRHASQTGTWTKDATIRSSDLNWGNLRGSVSDDSWNQASFINSTFPYTLTGKGVDVVIQDSGLHVSHPEFTDANGVSRVQQINWYTASGIPGTQSANHYRDYNGHGSHCAGTVAGKTLGWARDAQIYSVKVAGLEGDNDPTGISITDCFDVIKLWHRNKPIDPATGFKRPTVVNMSWGYSFSASTGTLSSGVYRGTSWTSATAGYTNRSSQWSRAGLVPVSRINTRIASVDVDLEELIDEGVHVCIAAGNSYFYIATEGDQDWDNTANFGSGQEYYMRGSSPYSTRAFMVGNLDIDYKTGLEHKAESSCCGPGVDIYAPGTHITSVASTDEAGSCELVRAGYARATSPLSGSHYLMKISGTSMAAPNVAGLVATLLETYPNATPAQMKTIVHNSSTEGLMYNGATDQWTDQQSIQNGPNRIFKSPFAVKENLTTNGPLTASGIEFN
jgi:subtilisin family serine protease